MKRANPHFFKCLALLLLFFSFAPLNAQAKNVYPLDPVYHRPEDITNSLWSRVDINQELCQWEIIGVSNNAKLPIYALSISNPKTGSEYSKPSVLFHGQHHGEEPIGVEIVFALSEYLLNNYGKDRQVTYFVDNYNLWFIPTMNPEGFAITNNGKYRLKRKNNTDTNLNGLLEIDKDGVDLNRNYPFNWDKDFNDNPESPYYKGFEPASESENRAMINFYAREQFQLALFYHTSATGNYSEKIYFPWKWNNITSPDYQEMLFLAKHLAKNLPNAYKKGHYSVQTLNTSQQGFARDYIYSQHNTLAFLLEVAGNSVYGEGIINPSVKELKKIVNKHITAAIKLLEEFDKNLIIGRVTDLEENCLPNIPLYIEEKDNYLKQPLLTNKEGYFFYYLFPDKYPYTLNIEGVTYLIYKDGTGKTEYSFALDSPTHPPIWQQSLNQGEAIILTDTTFQHFPPLLLNSAPPTQYDEFQMFVLKESGIIHQELLKQRENVYYLPWVPTNLISNGTIAILPYCSNPLLQKAEIANKIVVLKDEEEELTYAYKHSLHDPFYLQPDCQIGIDYSLYQATDTNYFIESIEIQGNKEYRSDKIELSLYDGASLLYRTNELSINNDSTIFQLPEIPLTNSLFLTVKNVDDKPLSIYRENLTHLQVTSNRTYIYYSEWQPLQGKDLAVKLLLRKR